jgi:formate hydrogenlyase transcriptional activator
LCLLDEDGKNVREYGEALEWEPFVNHGSTTPLQQSLSARAIDTRDVAFLTADDLRGRNEPLARAMYEGGVRSVCSVPLIAGNRVWGTLNPSSVTANAFGPPEIEYLQQVANQIAAALQNAHAYREIAELKDRMAQEKRYLEYEIRSANRSDDIIGDSPALKRVLDYAAIVADTDSTVLITGETGTGKERIARAIHSMSRRRERNFIKLNCAAIPTGLLESELFGHEKGAFTGAVSQKTGRLELADKGTLLLDEIGEIPLEVQPKLLRVLQDQEFERLGSTKTIHVDVRLIASTNRDLVRAVEEKEFRGDLFYRLHVFPLHLPPLRDRREDIPMLIRHFVEKCAVRLHKRIDVIPEEAVQAMVRWKWPGNIRELENFVERSVILSEGARLTPPLYELSEEILRQPSESDVTLRDKERLHIIEILRQTRGALSGPAGAAARLGLKRTTLQYKMQRLGIARTDYLG